MKRNIWNEKNGRMSGDMGDKEDKERQMESWRAFYFPRVAFQLLVSEGGGRRDKVARESEQGKWKGLRG